MTFRGGHSVLTFLVLVVGLYLVTLFVQVAPPIIPGEPTFSDAQKNAITVLIEMNKLLISLALLVSGGTATLMLKAQESIGAFRRGDRTLLLLSVVCNALSLSLGFQLYFRMLEMLSEKGFVAGAKMLRVVQQEQYYAFLGGVVFVAIVVVRRLDPDTGGRDEDRNDDRGDDTDVVGIS